MMDRFWRSKVKVTAGRGGAKAFTSTLGCWRLSSREFFIRCMEAKNSLFFGRILEILYGAKKPCLRVRL